MAGTTATSGIIPASLPRRAGADGCRGGWVVCSRKAGELYHQVVPNFSDILEMGFQRIAVDMPIGLAPLGQKRSCDSLARKRLGRRASCVFPAPPRDLLHARDYEQVRVHGLSLQSFYLLAKIRELDALITPQLQERVFETHPELVFQHLNAGTPLVSKKSEEGLQQRRELLNLTSTASFPKKLCSEDDILDSAALLRAAEEWADEPRRIPLKPERDSRGLRMEICF